MKYSHLRQIADYLKQLTQIVAIHRIDNNIIKIVFNGEKTLFCDMQKGNSHLFMCDSYPRTKVFQAPFDVVMNKRLNRSAIQEIALLNNDKILRITVSQSGSYKESSTIFQLEFTGKYTNAIILDTDETVLEALRHVDAGTSYRVVKVGHPLLMPPPPPYTPKEYPVDDVEGYLYACYSQEQEKRLQQLKEQKVSLLKKRLEKLQRHLENLSDEAVLLREVEEQQHFGHLILANIYRLKAYQRVIEIEDFDGTPLTITLPKEFPSVQAMGEYFFTRSKKLKQKAAHLHIERANLSEKIAHLHHFIQTVEEARDIASVKLLFPEIPRGEKKRTDESVETFWVEGYKIMLGKSEKGNIDLLGRARARDLWFHLKDRPSAHVIVVTDKQNVPQNVIEAAAKLCVDFSVFEKGGYLVDYTPRREIRIQEGANVLYNNYKTLHVEKG